MRENEQLAALLKVAAAAIASRGGVDLPAVEGPPAPWFIETTLNGCRYRVRVLPFAEAVEYRAKRLARVVPAGTRNHPLPGKPQQSRRPFSLATYQQFIDDGELDNAEAYRGLYDLTD